MNIMKEFKIELDQWDKSDLLCYITLLLLLFYIDDVWYLEQPIRVLCFLGLFFKKARLNIEFWVAIVSIFAASNLIHWYLIDNHMYLMLYWVLTLLISRIIFAISQSQESSLDILAFNGRWLLVCCMSLAVFWKLFQADYTDGSFFEFTLITDERFKNFASKIGHVDISKLSYNGYVEQNIFMLKELKHVLSSSLQIEKLAKALTWWTIGIEATIAILFLIPDHPSKRRFTMLKHWSLIFFILSTYLIAPVFGFAWLLILMGLACLPQGYGHMRLAYVITLLMTQLYRMPFGDYISYLF